MPLLHPLQPAVLGGCEALALDCRDVHDHGTPRRQRLAQRLAQRAHVVPVDHAHVRPVELLPPQARRPERLDRLLQLGTQPLERRADPAGQPRQPALDALARVPQLRVEANPVEIARKRTDVRRDRHAVVVQHHDHRRAQAAGLANRLESHATGHRPVADHRHDLAVPAVGAALAVEMAHPLLDADGIPDRRGRVTSAHDVVRGLLDRAERRETPVLADRREPIAATREDLVRIGLMADVPQDLVGGDSSSECSATASSHVPRLAPKCPPISPTVSMMCSRTSCASWVSSASDSAFRSSGPSMPSSSALRVACVPPSGRVPLLLSLSGCWWRLMRCGCR